MNYTKPEAERRLKKAVRMAQSGYPLIRAAKTYHVSVKSIKSRLNEPTPKNGI